MNEVGQFLCLKPLYISQNLWLGVHKSNYRLTNDYW